MNVKECEKCLVNAGKRREYQENVKEWVQCASRMQWNTMEMYWSGLKVPVDSRGILGEREWVQSARGMQGNNR